MERLLPLIFGVIAVVAALGGLVIWLVFLRPVPEQSGTGVIEDKVFQAAHTVSRPPSGTRRQDWSSRQMQMPDQYVFSIRLEERTTVASYAIGAAGADHFDIGQTVRVRYQQRGLPPFWTRLYILEMTPLSDSVR